MASPLDMPKKPKVRTISDEHPMGDWSPIPEKTYHGTPSEIKGDKILPASVHGGKSNWGDTGWHTGQESQKNTFSTPDEADAWHWGEKAVKGAVVSTLREPEYRNRVYEVTPGAHARHGTEVANEIVADSHTITGRKDIMPGRQGTFPDLNWNQFKDPDADIYDAVDVNHPSDPEVKYGHDMVGDGWTMRQATEHTVDYARGDMASDLQWDRGDRVTRESRRDRRFGEQTSLFPEPKDVGANRKKEAEIDHLRQLLTSPNQH